MCTLPIVNDNLKKLEVNFIQDHFGITSLTICYDASWGWKVHDLLEDVKKKLSLHEGEKLIAYITSYSACEPLKPDQTISEV